MRLTLRAITLALVLSAACHAVARQTPAQAPASASSSLEARLVLQSKAPSLLEEVVEDARGLSRAENRAFVLTAAADLLWQHDEERARSLFKEAADNVDAIMVGVASDDPEYERLSQAAAAGRRELLDALAKHDAQMALDLLRATLAPEPTYELRVRVAIQVAGRDPARATLIATESLSGGLSEELPVLLAQLQEADGDASDTLLRNIVGRLSAEDLMTDDAARVVARDILRLAAESRARVSNGGRGARPLDLQALGELIQLAATAAQNSPAVRADLLPSLQSLLLEVDRYAPVLAAGLSHKPGRVTQSPALRGGESGYPAEAGEGRATASGVGRPSTQEAVEELTRKALMMKGGNREGARALLNEAWGLAGPRAESAAQLNAQIQVARAYVTLEPTWSLLVVDSVIDRLNELADAMADLEGFVGGARLFHGGEMELSAANDLSAASDGGDSDELLRLLAETEFDRTRSSLDRFRRPELRVMARLRLARSVLRQIEADAPKPPR